MPLLSRRQFAARAALALAGSTGLAAAGSAPAAAAAPPEGRASFFLVGDTHYGADDVETGAMRAASADMNARLIGWMNHLPGAALPEALGGGTLATPHGVIHAGDIIDNGDKGPRAYPMAETEWAAFLADWGLNGRDAKLYWPVREVHGNHDSPRGEGPVVPEIKARNRRRQGVVNLSENGLHYSWDWAGVHFVALGLVVGDAPAVSRPRRYAPLGSLPFLVQDLADHVGTSGRPVVLVHHVDPARYAKPVADAVAITHEWDYGDVQAFYAALRPYRVAATLYGHTHVRNLFRWNGSADTRTGSGIPCVNTDNASHFGSLRQAILHLEVSDTELLIREFATADGWINGSWTPESWRFALASRL